MSLVIPCYNKLCPQRWRPALFLVFDILSVSVKSNVYLFLLRRRLIKCQWSILFTTSLIDLPNSNSSIVETPLRTYLWLHDCSLQRCRLRRRHSTRELVFTRTFLVIGVALLRTSVVHLVTASAKRTMGRTRAGGVDIWICEVTSRGEHKVLCSSWFNGYW